MTKWAATELDSAQRSSPTIFYPFSGPDFLNVVTMFPTSSTYVLIGLEPVGSVPARTSLQNPRLLPRRQSLPLVGAEFQLLPHQRHGRRFEIGGAGRGRAAAHAVCRPHRPPNSGHSPRAARCRRPAPGCRYRKNASRCCLKSHSGAEIKLRSPSGQPQTIYYFSADLSDAKLATQKAPLEFVRSLGPLTTYLKSASYLMHKSYFNQIRRLVLRRSRYILQDDSGIAMKYFQKGAWQFTHYGSYHRPINLFAKHYQPELTAAYKDSVNRPRLLPFGTGYNWQQKDSNLLIARRRIPVAE